MPKPPNLLAVLAPPPSLSIPVDLRRRRLLSRGAALAFSGALGMTAHAPRAHEILAGVNQVNMGLLSEREQEPLIAQIASSGARAVRLTLREPFGRSLNAVRLAHGAGLSVLLVVELHLPEYYPPGTKMRRGDGPIHDAYPLSAAAPRPFARRIREAWEFLDRHGVRLAAVQLGNEINWAAFNGDLRAREPSATTFDTGSFASSPVRSAFKAGLDRYVELARTLREVRDAGGVHLGVPLVASGLADIPREGAKRLQADSVRPALAMDLLRARGSDDVFDGYAYHLYFSTADSGEDSRSAERRVRGALAACAPDGKRCWISEWGIEVPWAECPVDDSGRARSVAALNLAFAAPDVHRRLGGVFYFQWRDASAHSLWRCGRATDSAREVVAAPVSPPHGD